MSAPDPFERAITAAAVLALRRRAKSIRNRASVGVTVLDRSPPVMVITSESATALRIAKSFDLIAAEIEARP